MSAEYFEELPFPASTFEATDGLVFQDYCSTFANDSLNLFQDCNFDFDASEFRLPELNFGDNFTPALELGVNPELDIRPSDDFPWGVDFVLASVSLKEGLGETEGVIQLE